MRLKVSRPAESADGNVTAAPPAHSSRATGVVFSRGYDAVSCSNDSSVRKWSSLQGQNASAQGRLYDAPQGSYCTCIDGVAGDTGSSFAVGFSDGSIVLLSASSGREEKKIAQAHRGGVVGLKWNYEGTAFASIGEDGTCKIFSKTGMLRTTLAQFASPVYACSWYYS